MTGDRPQEQKSQAQNDRQWAGQGAVLLCALLWSTSGLFIKLVSWHPLVIAGLRSLIAALFMLGVRVFITRPGAFKSSRKGLPNTKSLKGPSDTDARTGEGVDLQSCQDVGQTKLPTRKSLKGPMWAAAFCYALTMISFVIANKLTASANAILLQYGAPIWAAVLSWILIKERPHWEHWGALACVLGGLFLFFRDGISTGAFLGDSIAVFSGIVFGANSVFLRMQKDGNPADAMLLAHCISFAISIPFIIMYPPELTTGSVSAILFMGIFQIGCASLLFSYGVKHISAVQAMLIATIEPLLNPVWVLVITGERPPSSAITGGAIIIGAVVVSSLISWRRQFTIHN